MNPTTRKFRRSIAVRAIEGDGRRAEDAEVLEQRLVVLVVRRDVGLQQHGCFKRGLHLRLS